MPVDAVHGALHTVIECHTCWSPASKLSNVIDWPSVTVGILPPDGQVAGAVLEAADRDRAGQGTGAGAARVAERRLRLPPWLSFSGR